MRERKEYARRQRESLLRSGNEETKVHTVDRIYVCPQLAGTPWPAYFRSVFQNLRDGSQGSVHHSEREEAANILGHHRGPVALHTLGVS